MFYGIPSSIKSYSKKEIKGVIGFIGGISKYCKELNPYSVIVIFDSEKSTSNNRSIDCLYKANRIDYSLVEEENNPFSQLEKIKYALKYLDIINFECEENEADDYIASISYKYKRKFDIIIVSTDYDFIQLISKKIKLFVPGKNSKIFDKKEVLNMYNVRPRNFIRYKALVGDKSDNIKGVYGIGPKKAIQMLKGNNEVYLKNKETIEKNIKLISLNKKICIPFLDIKKINYACFDKKIKEIIKIIKEN
jgi:DNA polymerase-1